MKISKSIKPTDKELEILQVVWEQGPVSVKEVQVALGGDQSNGYTTILKLLQIMHEKGLVTRQKSGKLHLYKAAANEEQTKLHLLSDMIKDVFQGSAAQLVMSALGNHQSTKEELSVIRNYLDKMDQQKK